MNINRREFNKTAFATFATAGFTTLSVTAANALDAPIRLPLHEFVADKSRLQALRKGVAAMKMRKPSDPLSWTFQAAIHGYTDEMLKEWEKVDPNVASIDHKKYWNQCPHFGQNSANFLPWHRAYTHHFESILRIHTGDSSFALPYWDISIDSQRAFPREFGIQHLDGDVGNNAPSNINPLFHRQRDFFLCGYEHPFTDQLPLVELSKRATDDSRAVNTPIFFGDNEAAGLGGGVYDNDTSTRGLLEQAPHDQIHRAIGGQVSGITFPDDSSSPISGTSVGGMAIPMTAGYDPIFSVHHSNMDRLWALWSCLPGKSWGKTPEKSWFHEKPWYFFDENGNEVNLPRKDYFDHRSMGVRFKNEDLTCEPLKLPDDILSEEIVTASNKSKLSQIETVSIVKNHEKITLTSKTTTSIDIINNLNFLQTEVTNFANKVLAKIDQAKRIQIQINDIEHKKITKTGYDVYLVSKTTNVVSLTNLNVGYLGSLSLFVHSMDPNGFYNQTFDITNVLKNSNSDLRSLKLVLIPYQLTSNPKVSDIPIEFGTNMLTVHGFTMQFIE